MKQTMIKALMLVGCVGAGSIQAESCKAPEGCSSKLFINALYWQAREEGLDYMIKNHNQAVFINSSGTVERAEFDWNGGFRIGASYGNYDCYPIDFTIAYTRFTTDGCDKLATTYPTVLFPVWSNPRTNIVFEQDAQAKLCLSLNMVDAQMSKAPSSDCVDIMPVLGVRYARIHQNFNINAQGALQFVNDDAITMQNNFRGAGPKFGINSTWGSWRGLSIFGSVDLALIYGKFEIKQKEVVEFTNSMDTTTYLDVTCNRFNITRPNIGFALGLQWEQVCGCYDWRISAGWEHQYFFGQNQLLRFSDDVNPGSNTAVQGDLGLQGLTVGLDINF